MNNKCIYKIRVVDSIKHQSHYEENLTFSEAIDRFYFYVKCALELNLSVWCVNILKGKQKKSYITFINHD